MLAGCGRYDIVSCLAMEFLCVDNNTDLSAFPLLKSAIAILLFFEICVCIILIAIAIEYEYQLMKGELKI